MSSTISSKYKRYILNLVGIVELQIKSFNLIISYIVAGRLLNIINRWSSLFY